jgi:hypothetical protein
LTVPGFDHPAIAMEWSSETVKDIVVTKIYVNNKIAILKTLSQIVLFLEQ